MLKKYIIKNDRTDVNIKIGLRDNVSMIGYQDEVDNLTQIKSIDSINENVDNELRRFKFYGDSEMIFKFWIDNSLQSKFSGTTVDTINRMFTSEELILKKPNVLNSFFIIDTYDSYDEKTNNKLSTNYLTDITSKNYQNKPNVQVNTPRYLINNTIRYPLYYLYIPEYFIKEVLSDTNKTTNIYAKLLFYNAKVGKVTVFTNPNVVNQNTDEKLYFKIEININRTWKFIETLPLNLEEIPLTDTEYLDKINSSFDKTNILKQTYPTGDTFTYIERKYV